MKHFVNWLTDKFAPRKASQGTELRRTGAHLRQTGKLQRAPGVRPATRPEPAQQEPAKPAGPEGIDIEPHLEGRIEDLGPGKNVLIRNKYVREDSGTHDTLKILDDSVLETDEETGLDPYNTGQFDRSRNWDKRFRN